jgi:zinc protease
VWPTVGVHSDDQPALDLLSDILGSSRVARLTKHLVYDNQLATNVFAFQNPNENVGQFQIVSQPRPGHSLTELETAIDSIVDVIKRTGPTADELKRVKAGQQAQFISGLQSNLNKVFQLAEDETFHKDPSYSFRVGYAKTQAVTADDIKRVANKYLGKTRIVLSTVPLGKTEVGSHADKSTVVTDPFTEAATGGKP